MFSNHDIMKHGLEHITGEQSRSGTSKDGYLYQFVYKHEGVRLETEQLAYYVYHLVDNLQTFFEDKSMEELPYEVTFEERKVMSYPRLEVCSENLPLLKMKSKHLKKLKSFKNQIDIGKLFVEFFLAAIKI